MYLSSSREVNFENKIFLISWTSGLRSRMDKHFARGHTREWAVSLFLALRYFLYTNSLSDDNIYLTFVSATRVLIMWA